MMENDIISLFLNRKKQNISQYTEFFVQYTLKGNIKLNKIISKIVEIYIDHFYLEKNLDFTLLMPYFEIKKTSESLMKDILLSSVIFYKNSGLEKQIERDIKTIVILSNLIYLSLVLDSCVNEYEHEKIPVEKRIEFYVEKYQDKIRVPKENLELLVNDLTTQIKKDVIAEKKFWKNITTPNYILTLTHSLKNSHYVFVDYHYDIKMLSRYTKEEIEKTRLTKGINDDILTIYLEQLSVLILKDLLSKNYDDYLCIHIYGDYFNKNKNLMNLKRIFENSSVKKHLIFCFEFETIKDNINVLKYLNEEKFNVGLTHIDNSSIIESTTFDMFNFVFISSLLFNKYQNYKELWTLKKINFVIDDEQMIPIDEIKLLNGSRCYNE